MEGKLVNVVTIGALTRRVHSRLHCLLGFFFRFLSCDSIVLLCSCLLGFQGPSTNPHSFYLASFPTVFLLSSSYLLPSTGSTLYLFKSSLLSSLSTSNNHYLSDLFLSKCTTQFHHHFSRIHTISTTMGPFKKSLAGPGYVILNTIRVMNIISLLAVVTASVVMLVKTFIVSQFFFFDACSHIVTASLSSKLHLPHHRKTATPKTNKNP